MKKKILLVDDSGFIRKILRDLLEKEYNIIEAETGDEAIDQFTKEKPDLMLLDIIMPNGEEEGLIVLKKIMKLNSKAKVVMLSAIGQDVMIEECKKLGAVDYIVKPFNDKLVMETVRKHLI